MSKVQLHIVSRGREAWMLFRSIHTNPFCPRSNPAAHRLWRLGFKAADDVDRLLFLCVQGDIGNWK